MEGVDKDHLVVLVGGVLSEERFGSARRLSIILAPYLKVRCSYLSHPVGVEDSQPLEATTHAFLEITNMVKNSCSEMETTVSTSAMDCRFLSGFCCFTAPEVLGLP